MLIMHVNNIQQGYTLKVCYATTNNRNIRVPYTGS